MNDSNKTEDKLSPEKEFPIITSFGMPLLVPESELIYYIVLQEGWKHDLFPIEQALFSEYDFMNYGWQQAG